MNNVDHLTPCMTNYLVEPKCNFCGVFLTPKNHEQKEHVDISDGEVAPICDDCYQEKFHEQAKAWCMKHCRPIQR